METNFLLPGCPGLIKLLNNVIKFVDSALQFITENKGWRFIFFLFQLSLFTFYAGAQSIEEETKPNFYIEPNLMVGKIVKTYNNFPQSKYRQSLYLDFGFYDNRTHNSASYFYNNPSSGISLAYSVLGNDSVFGRELDLVPFLDLNVSRRLKNPLHFKFGIGASYFSKHYDRLSNPTNELIGSALSWSFEGFIYKNIITRKQWNFKVGAGYLHSSNGHTQLPNFGMNSVMLSLAAQYLAKPIISTKNNRVNLQGVDRTKHFFIQSRFGLGYHELGGTSGPIGGPKKLVYTGVVAGGIVLKQHIKIRAGFSYRFYEHYYEYILSHPNKTLVDDSSKLFITHSRWNASVVTFIGGCEFLYNHIGMDIESGINISKPFYRHFNNLHENDNPLFYFLKSFFATRMGLNYYFISTKKNPRNNIFIGAHINANFGQADFSEASIGYTYKIK